MEGVFVEFAVADEASFSAEERMDDIRDDLRLGMLDSGVMRNEKNPARQDPLLIIDPITFIASGEPSMDLTDLQRPGGCVDTACTADDGEHMQRAIYNWEEPRIRSTNELSPREGEEADDSSVPWWVIVVIPAGLCCCCALVALLQWRRRQSKKVTFKDFAEGMGMAGTKGDDYAVFQDQEMKGVEPRTLEASSPTAAQGSGARRLSDEAPTTMISIACQRRAPLPSPRHLRQGSSGAGSGSGSRGTSRRGSSVAPKSGPEYVESGVV